MNKNDFLVSAQVYLELLGYRRYEDYWYMKNEQLVYGVQIRGSWDSDDYCVDVGVAVKKDAGAKPPVSKWQVCRRCVDSCGQDRNIPLSALIAAIEQLSRIHTVDELRLFAAAEGDQA